MTASELRTAFGIAVAEGARDIVVELGARPAIDADFAEALRGIAASLLARGALLWLAAPRPDDQGHTLRPIRDASVESLRGVSDELDRVLPHVVLPHVDAGRETTS